MMGDKNCQSANSERSKKKFLRTTPFWLAQNSTKLSRNITSKLRKCQKCVAISKNSSAEGGLSEFLGGGSCPQASPVVPSLFKTLSQKKISKNPENRRDLRKLKEGLKGLRNSRKVPEMSLNEWYKFSKTYRQFFKCLTSLSSQNLAKPSNNLWNLAIL